MEAAQARAFTDYNKAISLSPDFAAAYYGLGSWWQARSNWDEAQADFTKVVRLRPDSVLLSKTFFHLGSLKLSQGETNASLKHFAEAYANRALVEASHADRKNALADFTKAMVFNPVEGTYYCNRGLVKEKLADVEGALSDYNQIIRLDPANASAYVNRGGVRVKENDLPGALADFDKAIQIDPNEANGYQNRAILWKRLGDGEGSLADEARAIELRTHQPRLKF